MTDGYGWAPPPAPGGGWQQQGGPPPPYGQGTSPWGAWPPPPARRSRRSLWITLGLLFVVVAGCSGVVAKVAYREIHGADMAVNHFLDAAEDGDTARALGYACPDWTVADVPTIRHHKVRSVNVHSGSGGATGEVTVDVTFPDGRRHRDVLRLEKHGGAWLVCDVQRSGAP